MGGGERDTDKSVVVAAAAAGCGVGKPGSSLESTFGSTCGLVGEGLESKVRSITSGVVAADGPISLDREPEIGVDSDGICGVGMGDAVVRGAVTWLEVVVERGRRGCGSKGDSPVNTVPVCAKGLGRPEVGTGAAFGAPRVPAPDVDGVGGPGCASWKPWNIIVSFLSPSKRGEGQLAGKTHAGSFDQSLANFVARRKISASRSLEIHAPNRLNSAVNSLPVNTPTI